MVQVFRYTPRYVRFRKFVHFVEECCGIRKVSDGAEASAEEEDHSLAVRRA